MRQTAPFELSTQQALLKVSYDFHIAGNGLYTMLVTTLKDSKTSKHVSIFATIKFPTLVYRLKEVSTVVPYRNKDTVHKRSLKYTKCPRAIYTDYRKCPQLTFAFPYSLCFKMVIHFSCSNITVTPVSLPRIKKDSLFAIDKCCVLPVHIFSSQCPYNSYKPQSEIVIVDTFIDVIHCCSRFFKIVTCLRNIFTVNFTLKAISTAILLLLVFVTRQGTPVPAWSCLLYHNSYSLFQINLLDPLVSGIITVCNVKKIFSENRPLAPPTDEKERWHLLTRCNRQRYCQHVDNSCQFIFV